MMKPFRLLSIGLIASLLVACDQPSPQQPAPTPAPPQTEQKAASAVPGKPAASPAQPAPVPAKSAEPATSAKPAQASANTPKPQPAKVDSRKAPESKLDLRLPPELAKQVEMDDALDTVPQEPLLPPMFVEKEPPPAPFQLNGRLLTNDQPSSDNSVQGAELQFQFRN
ncbi:hypothetical protein [Pseudomonas sp. LRF_L74]|uniref:hypothetical protein n=1 Tax=Pseudomonas sp. LRF_L74 TaxID=3369422 RepID=UPI003F62F2CA